MSETTQQTFLPNNERPFFRFTVLGLPFPQPRPRANNRGEFVRMYTPDPTGRLGAWKRAIALQSKAAGVRRIQEGPVSVTIVIFLPRPKTHFRSGLRAGELRPGAPTYPVAMSRDDVDNHAKSVLDSLTGIAWNDDAQVVKLAVVKKYEVSPRKSGAVITIKAIGEDESVVTVRDIHDTVRTTPDLVDQMEKSAAGELEDAEAEMDFDMDEGMEAAEPAPEPPRKPRGRPRGSGARAGN